jgi:hypothetical protein
MFCSFMPTARSPRLVQSVTTLDILQTMDSVPINLGIIKCLIMDESQDT